MVFICSVFKYFIYACLMNIQGNIFVSNRLRFSFTDSALAAPNVLSLVSVVVAILLYQSGYELFLWAALAIGFLVIGLPHGAVDHVTDLHLRGWSRIASFIAVYLLKAFALALLWLMLPSFALTVFLCYSAWHFGQTDFTEWNLSSRFNSFLWGSSVLMLMFLFHFEETISIVREIPGLRSVLFFEMMNRNTLFLLQLIPGVISLVLVVKYKSWNMLMTLLYIFLGILLPLVILFGIYFVFQHSVQGWKHLKVAMQTSYKSLWLKSLPYSIAGIVFLSYVLWMNPSNYFGIFFVVLSCISIPHVMSMDHFYRMHSLSNKS